MIRTGLEIGEVKRIAVPEEGGIRDLTAQGLIESMGWADLPQLRFPSGDGAILSFIGVSADIIERALAANKPRVDAIRSDEAMNRILALMQKLESVDELPQGYRDMRFLDAAQERAAVNSGAR